MAEEPDDRQDVLDWYLDLDADRRELVVSSPTELMPREMERRAELASWMRRCRQQVDEESLAEALADRRVPESKIDSVVREVLRVGPMEAVEDVASAEGGVFDAVAGDVLGSYLDSDDGPDAAELDDGHGDLRLLLSRTLVALYHGEVDGREARRRLMETGASPESVDLFLEGVRENLDEIDLHLRRVKVEELSREIRRLRWDALGR